MVSAGSGNHSRMTINQRLIICFLWPAIASLLFHDHTKRTKADAPSQNKQRNTSDSTTPIDPSLRPRPDNYSYYFSRNSANPDHGKGVKYFGGQRPVRISLSTDSIDSLLSLTSAVIYIITPPLIHPHT